MIGLDVRNFIITDVTLSVCFFRYQVVMQTTTEESRKAGDNLNRLLEVIATHVVSIEVSKI